MQFSKEVLEKFGSNVDFKFLSNGDLDHDACWDWVGSRDKSDYGRFRINGKQTGTHRVAYMMEIGDIPWGYCVCHKCDNPSCVNPKHLWVGTDQDNTNDKVSKNRQLQGSNHHSAKLIESDVREILINIYNNQYISTVQIYNDYDVTSAAINDMLRGKSWKTITNIVTEELGVNLQDLHNSINACTYRRLQPPNVRKIKKIIRETDLTDKDISIQFSVKQNTVSKIRSGKTWSHVK
jgi:hypothetical protein